MVLYGFALSPGPDEPPEDDKWRNVLWDYLKDTKWTISLTEDVVDTLIAVVQDEESDWKLDETAATLLGQSGSERAIPALTGALGVRRLIGGISWRAEHALEKIGTEEAMRALLDKGSLLTQFRIRLAQGYTTVRGMFRHRNSLTLHRETLQDT